MDSSEKELYAPCSDVLDRIIADPDRDAWSRAAARTVKEHGLQGAFQERVLADECVTSGARDACPHADECGIGDIEHTPPAIPGHRRTD